MVEPVGAVTTDGYLSGMQTVMTNAGEDRLAPAGLLEILAAGGLTSNDLKRIGAITVGEAHLASLSETVPDIADCQAAFPGWRIHLAADCHALLGDRIIRK
jgi:hypothetical protein